jgi:hypothetical protein
MIKTKLVLSALILSSLYSVQSSASVFHIDEMNIASGTITRNFKPVPDTIDLNLNSNTNLIGGYINKDTGGAISETNFNGMGQNPAAPTQYVYTAASNINHNNHSEAPAPGTHLGDSVPSGTVDDVAGTITMDLSSWFANHGKMDQNLGSANAAGTWDVATGEYDLSWTAFLTQGSGAANPLASVTWNLQGNVLETSPVPVPGAVWLMGTALLGLQRF